MGFAVLTADEVNSTEFSVMVNVAEDILLDHIRENAKRKLMFVSPQPERDGIAMIVGGGPSLAESLGLIRRMSESGAAVFALNGAAPYLRDAGIGPDYMVMIDARRENAEFVKSDPAVKYILASQVHPDVFDGVDPNRTMIFHCGGIDLSLALPKGTNYTAINGGITVGLTSIALAFTLGYRNFHVFGLDSSVRGDAMHAYPQGENSLEGHRLHVRLGDDMFVTSFCMMKQAEKFPILAASIAEAGGVITVHGDGLLPAVAHQMAADRAAAQ